LNKADEITPGEMLKIQNNLVWNVSPHMASLEPPRLYAGSFWSHPYKNGAPKELLQTQEASLLRDIREAIDKRVENRISTARRFAVIYLIIRKLLSEFSKQVFEASSRSEFSKRVLKVSSQSEFSKRVLKASSQSEFSKRVLEASSRSELSK
jgi:hypothetical protein